MFFIASYWANFAKWWGNLFGSQNGIVMIVLGVALIALFIITRGKWMK